MVQQGKRGIGLWIGSIVLLASWVVLGDMVGDGTAAESSRAQPAPSRGAAADPTTPVPSGVIVKGGKLSVSLQGARFQDVMEAISLQGGIEISVVGGAGQTTLTASFRGLPLEEGLVSLLQDKNFAFVYSEVEGERRVSRVIVTPRRSGQHSALGLRPRTSTGGSHRRMVARGVGHRPPGRRRLRTRRVEVPASAAVITRPGRRACARAMSAGGAEPVRGFR